MRITQIVKIEKLPEKYDKYDLTVSNTHNFFANGILIHNCQNLADEDIEKNFTLPLECTLKADGTSTTIFYSPTYRPDDPFGVCSRNFELKDEPSTYWDMVHALSLETKLPEYCKEHDVELAVQGEITGPGIQSNRDKQDKPHFSVFRIWDIRNQCWLEWEERYAVCEALGLEHVPVLGTYSFVNFAPFDEASQAWKADPVAIRDKILAFAEGKTPSGNEREGLVFKSNDGTVSFKAVSNKYLLGLK